MNQYDLLQGGRWGLAILLQAVLEGNGNEPDGIQGKEQKIIDNGFNGLNADSLRFR